MNLPSKLTMLRIIMIPAIVILYVLRNAIGNEGLVFIIMGLIFLVAAITDYFDGKIARARNIVTTFGKFIDPLADKLLVLGTLMIFSDFYANNFQGTTTMWMPFWVTLIILARELIVTSIRLVAVGEGIILHASKWGKYKTAFTMLTIVYYFFIMPIDNPIINIIGISMVGISVILTIGSGIDYFAKNKHVILQSI